MLKRVGVSYLLGWLIIISYLVLQVCALVIVYESRSIIDDYYQRDFVNINIISEQLIWDIEKASNKKLPLVELNIRLSENLETGIRYKDNSKTLEIFLPLKMMGFDNNQKRAYLAHELGHYILGHCLLSGQPKMFCKVEEGDWDLKQEIEADSFALKFSKIEDISLDIKILVWDENEKEIRLNALRGN